MFPSPSQNWSGDRRESVGTALQSMRPWGCLSRTLSATEHSLRVLQHAAELPAAPTEDRTQTVCGAEAGRFPEAPAQKGRQPLLSARKKVQLAGLESMKSWSTWLWMKCRQVHTHHRSVESCWAAASKDMWLALMPVCKPPLHLRNK